MQKKKKPRADIRNVILQTEKFIYFIPCSNTQLFFYTQPSKCIDISDFFFRYIYFVGRTSKKNSVCTEKDFCTNNNKSNWRKEKKRIYFLIAYILSSIFTLALYGTESNLKFSFLLLCYRFSLSPQRCLRFFFWNLLIFLLLILILIDIAIAL